ncbi:hypothetical protein PSHT_11731 [Puccinia striiformis]|uniref:HAT C-terminal dimerisation domain-containing protein n=1 Tax=Puccinia striiformis TaxID=27350 RepID=A0A2S4V1A8_9BASI|nr:hypothetical protein PSHT_11731 [Puccinia striiformis]
MADPAPPPHQTPSPAPSRQSTRVITPVRTDPNFIRPSQDSRKSLSQRPATTDRGSEDKTNPKRPRKSASTNSTASKPKAKRQKRKKKKTIASGDEGETSDSHVIDITQDSDLENEKVKKKERAKNFDNIKKYFEAPFHEDPEYSGDAEKMMYKCRWCHNPYKKSKGTFSNLTKHRDAITAGAKLPLTAKELEKMDIVDQKEAMTHYLKHSTFDMRVFNQLLVMWIVRFSLPWSRIEDFLLEVAFNYVRRGTHLNSRTWVATEAHRLYLNLQAKVVSTLQNLSSKITLIHDVWTTKGNHHAFMGISVAYITDDWNFKISHLALKYMHQSQGKAFGPPLCKRSNQTTDSGSNNFTMATEVDRLILKKTGVYLDLKANHIRCFCHKLALILNAGLQALSLATDGYLPSRETLGFVPNLSPITEESSEIKPTDHFVVEDVVLDDPLSFDENNHPEQISSGAPCSKTHHILQKVDFIIQRITSSAAKRAEYEHWCKILKPTGQGLIAGYGIRWNIKFESRDRALHSRKVIAKLLENETDRQDKEGGKNYFSNFEISRDEWDVVETLNETLSEFYFLTKKTEGDISSGCTMISDYQCLMSFINEKLESCTEPEFKNMFNKMLSKTKTYLDEALDCDAIVIATALNPCFRLSIFQAWFPSHYSRAHKLLQDLYNEKKEELTASTQSKGPVPPPEKKQVKGSKRLVHQFDFFPNAVEAPVEDELTIYLGGKWKVPSEEEGDSLKWWKPGISSLAVQLRQVSRGASQLQQTLAVLTGSLAAKTIERCVSSHQWLVQGLQPDGAFETAQDVINQATQQKARDKARKAMAQTSKL